MFSRILGFTLISALLFVAACAERAPRDADGEADLEVRLNDFNVVMATTELSAGTLRIAVTNEGPTVHDLLIMRTDAEIDGLPLSGAQVIEVPGRVGKTRSLDAGAGQTITVTLEPGRYIFLCNEPGHYALGMRVEVQVR